MKCLPETIPIDTIGPPDGLQVAWIYCPILAWELEVMDRIHPECGMTLA